MRPGGYLRPAAATWVVCSVTTLAALAGELAILVAAEALGIEEAPGRGGGGRGNGEDAGGRKDSFYSVVTY